MVIICGLISSEKDHITNGELLLKSTLLDLTGHFSVHVESRDSIIDSLSISGKLFVKKFDRKVGIEEISEKSQFFQIDDESPVLVELHPLLFDKIGGLLNIIIFTAKGERNEILKIARDNDGKFELYRFVKDDNRFHKVSNIKIIARGNMLNASNIKIEDYVIE